MKPEEITALAREYAEIECPEFKYKGDKEWRNDDIKSATLSNAAFLTWLLRRYALVEKRKVEEEYHEAKFTCGNVDPCSETFATRLAQKSVLERLFPDLTWESDPIEVELIIKRKKNG